MNLKYENICHEIQPSILIASTIILGLAIFQRMFINHPKETTVLFQFLIALNLILLIFVITERFMMIRKILKLEMKIGKSKGFISFMLNNKKSFMFWAVFLVFVNINSLFYPNYMALLFFINLFSKKNGQNYASSAILHNVKLIIGILLLIFSAQYMFSLLIDPNHADTIMPIFNIHTNYDINMVAAFSHIWDDQFTQKGKLYYFLCIVMAFLYIFFASIIYYYVEKEMRESEQSSFCLLCKASDQSKISQSSNQEINRHI